MLFNSSNYEFNISYVSGSLLGDLTFDYLVGVQNGVTASIAQCEDKEAQRRVLSHTLCHIPMGT